LLRSDRNTPWDGRREYFLAMGFSNLNQTDSALVYSEKLYEMKPKHPKNLLITCQMLEGKKENDKVAEYLNTFLAENKNNDQVWAFAASFFVRNGNLDKAWSIIEEAKQYLPNDTLVDKQYQFVYQKKFVEPFMQEYITARQYYDKKDYPAALAHINTLIGNVPDYFEARQLRAFIYYYMNDYSKCIEEISYAMSLSENTGALFNLRGVCYRSLNDMESSCKDFMKAMQMGNTDGKTNYERFCKINLPL
jgi:tetratricopeptide (TPR) repeat protein